MTRFIGGDPVSLTEYQQLTALGKEHYIYATLGETPVLSNISLSLSISHSLPSAVKQSQNKPAEIHFSGRGGCGGALKDQLECAFAEDIPMRARQDKQTECRGQVAIKKVRKVHW